MVKAIEEYKNGAPSSEVSLKYGVPGSIISNHGSNSRLGLGNGRPTAFTIHQEKYLVELLKNLQTIGVRLMKAVVMKLGSEYVKLLTTV